MHLQWSPLLNPTHPRIGRTNYASNLTVDDSVVNITNSGANGASVFGPGFGPAVGNICVNVYTFSPEEQLVSGCSCLLTANALVSLSVKSDLISNTLAGVARSGGVIKLLSTRAGGEGAGGSGTSCTNIAAIHAVAAAAIYAVTETAFMPSTLTAGELASITNSCTNVIGYGTGFGIYRSCRFGGLGAGKM